MEDKMKKLSNAPVFFVIAQIKFGTLTEIEGSISKIQKFFKKAGFPDYRKEFVHQMAITVSGEAGASQPSPTTSVTPRFVFGSFDKSTEFCLENNSLTLLTAKYEDSVSFFDTFKKGLTEFNDILNIEFYERIGLRYLNAIVPQNEEDIHLYLANEIIGISGKLNSNQIHYTYCETLSVKGDNQLVSRSIIRSGKIGMPQDMAIWNNRIDKKISNYIGEHAIIDTDAYCEQRELFNVDKIIGKLDTLHNEIWESFSATVTPHAFSAWE
jgi:uncharacterized protein (TIGR04255 family)